MVASNGRACCVDEGGPGGAADEVNAAGGSARLLWRGRFARRCRRAAYSRPLAGAFGLVEEVTSLGLAVGEVELAPQAEGLT
jgi:hypothetical protein